MMNIRVVYRCVVNKYLPRYEEELYCVQCAQLKPKDSHQNDDVRMIDDDQYLLKYREDLVTQKRETVHA